MTKEERNIWYRKYYKANAKKIIAQKRKWKQDHIEQVKKFKSYDGRERAWRKRNIELTSDQYKALLAEQNFSCKICNIAQSDLIQKLAVDHDHKTGRIRGLLCHNCNRGLGYFKDNKDSLLKAHNYL